MKVTRWKVITKHLCLLLTVPPDPRYPVVKGCNHGQYCVLHIQQGDRVTCSILRIRPEVELQWKVVQTDHNAVSFTDQIFTVKQNGDTYDVVLISVVEYSLTTDNRITVKCSATGTHVEAFHLSTTLDLLIEKGKYADNIICGLSTSLNVNFNGKLSNLS